MAGYSAKMANTEFDVAHNAQIHARNYINCAIEGIKRLRRQRQEIKVGIRNSLSPKANKIENALQDFFGKASNSVLNSVIKTLWKIDDVLADDGETYKFKCINNSTKFGRALFCGRSIKLGKPFFETSFRNQVITIIHETGHIVGLNFLIPELYEGKSRNMPTLYRLYNADDIAMFVFEVGREKVEMSPNFKQFDELDLI